MGKGKWRKEEGKQSSNTKRGQRGARGGAREVKKKQEGNLLRAVGTRNNVRL